MITKLEKFPHKYAITPLKKVLNKYTAKILIYHNVLPEKSEFFDGFVSTIHPTQFEKQIMFLKKNIML